MNRELILSSGAVNVYLALHLWSSDALECVLGWCPVQGLFMTWSITRIVVAITRLCGPAP